MNWYGVGASFLGAGVEFVEALTIILAVGSIRGWKSALFGAVSAILTLTVLVVVIGAPLAQVVQIWWIQLLVGLFMLLFGIRWLRKAILRYSGLKKRHDEAESYTEELERQKKAGPVASGIDKFAFSTTYSGTFLEGLEAIFIVITFGLSTHSIGSSAFGAALAVVVVVLGGVLLRKPMARVPENTMKFIVGVMLTSFGAFWVGEGIGVTWPQNDLSVLYLAISLCLLSFFVVQRCKAGLNRTYKQSNTSVGGGRV